MTHTNLDDYGHDFLVDLPPDELANERRYLFAAIAHHLRCHHPRELREAQAKLIAVTAARHEQRKQKENPRP